MPYPVAAVRNKNFGNVSYSALILGLAPLAYWPLNETSGTTAYDQSGNGYNGTYTGVTLGQAGQGGQTCPLFDGSAGYVNIYSAGLNAALDRDEYSFAIWVKPYNSDVWTDGTIRRAINLYTAGTAQEKMFVQRTATNNELQFSSSIGGTAKSVYLSAQSWTGWTHLALTASKAANQVKAYLNGAQVGSTQTGLGTVSADALATDTCNIGCLDNSPAVTSAWNGWTQYVALWNRPLTAPEVASLKSFFP